MTKRKEGIVTLAPRKQRRRTKEYVVQVKRAGHKSITFFARSNAEARAYAHRALEMFPSSEILVSEDVR